MAAKSTASGLRTDKPPVLILSFTDHRSDPRVFRQIEALKDCVDLTTAGICPFTTQGTRHIQLVREKNRFHMQLLTALNMKLGRFEQRYWNQNIVKDALGKLSGSAYDVILNNDLETLPVALKLANNCDAKVYFDAHEYEPRALDESFFFNFFFASYYDYLCGRYLNQVDHMTTVCQGIAEEYEDQYGMTCEVVNNAPNFADLNPTKVDPQNVRMIHHGGVHPSRKLENMIELVGSLLGRRYSLDLMLVKSDSAYFSSIKAASMKYSNVRIIDPVPMPDIPKVINQYDIGLYLLPPASFNNELALPNKLFEFIQGRLAVVIWPSQEMRKIVEDYQLGVVSEEFSLHSIAKKLNDLSTEKIVEFKRNSAAAASVLNAEVNAIKLKTVVEQLAASSSDLNPSGNDGS